MALFEKYEGERKEHKKRRKEKKAEKPKKKKRKLGVLGILLLALLLAIVILFAVVFLRINVIDSGDQTRIDKNSEWFEKSEYAGGNRLTSDDVKLYSSGDVYFDKDVTNILLIGQDRRKGEGRTRSDTMIIMSINKKTNEITLVSLMRDMYVMIPGFSNNKLNAAYAFGGMQLIDETIAKNFGIRIDGNVEVDFDGFKEVIAQLGGVTVNLSKEEAGMLSTYYPEKSFAAGNTKLKPDEALTFVQDRSVMSGYDYNRTERQRKLVMAVYQEMKTQDVSKSIALINSILEHVTTDINPLKAVQYAIPILYSLKDSKIYSKRIPVNGYFYDANVDGMSVLVPDLLWNRIYLQSYLYGTAIEKTQSDRFKLLKKLYSTNPKEFNKYDGYFRCTLDMKAYGIM